MAQRLFSTHKSIEELISCANFLHHTFRTERWTVIGPREEISLSMTLAMDVPNCSSLGLEMVRCWTGMTVMIASPRFKVRDGVAKVEKFEKYFIVGAGKNARGLPFSSNNGNDKIANPPEAFYVCKQKTNNQCGEDTLASDTTITRGAIETITQPSTFITRDSSTKWQICDPRSNNVRPTYEIRAIQAREIMRLRQFRINVRFQPFAKAVGFQEIIYQC
ncbi:hypothetical protein NPIL_32711 [Nephila pilipes]|uniref:Uncharacterized protein n=1 Tax=Nephila pilipes TaxID=299642 RepID=A0A8X6N8S8_NEPPI|nr:hypothetical protein NPIL_32711 [Nephila pilipes]